MNYSVAVKGRFTARVIVPDNNTGRQAAIEAAEATIRAALHATTDHIGVAFDDDNEANLMDED